jgi:hypothetical protein
MVKGQVREMKTRILIIPIIIIAASIFAAIAFNYLVQSEPNFIDHQ